MSVCVCMGGGCECVRVSACASVCMWVCGKVCACKGVCECLYVCGGVSV